MADADDRWTRRLFLTVPSVFLVLFFILPLMAYPAAMALSGLIRFLQWLGRH